MSALFITFEGGEGSGKTTLLEGVAQWLESHHKRVLKTREPGGTALGEKIRDLLLHTSGSIASLTELFLFLSSRAQHVEEKILPALRNGTIVLCDRFNDSTIAYQGIARELGKHTVREACKIACQGLEPHLTFYLDIAPALAFKRVQRSHDRIESAGLAFHEKIRQAFLELQKESPQRIILLDATQSKETVLKSAIAFLSKRYTETT